MMTSKEILRKRLSIDKKIHKLQLELVNLMDSCTHDDAYHVNKADTGNYSTSDDSYWTEHRCKSCNKFWITDQHWDRKINFQHK